MHATKGSLPPPNKKELHGLSRAVEYHLSLLRLLLINPKWAGGILDFSLGRAVKRASFPRPFMLATDPLCCIHFYAHVFWVGEQEADSFTSRRRKDRGEEGPAPD